MKNNRISNFIRYNRTKNGMTQGHLAKKAGVGLRFIRELEQGKETLRMDKVNQVLALFGFQITPGNQRINDPYELLMHHSNKNVHVLLKDKTMLVGSIIDSITENNTIKAWKFLSNNNAIKYKETKDPNLVQTIEHTDIEDVENI